MSNLPVISEHFSGGARLTAADRSEGVPLYELLNSLGMTVESVTAMSANVTLAAATDAVIKAASRGLSTNTGTARTYTLPPFATAEVGWQRTFLALDGNTNAFTVARAGTDTINGATSYVLEHDQDSVVIMKVSGATDWVAVGTTPPNSSRTVVTFSRVPLIASGNAIMYYIHRGPSAVITRLDSALSAALATANATLTANIGVTAVTNGVLTITQSGSAAGDLDTATPTAANVLADGDVLRLVLGGGNTAAVFADVSIHLVH